MMFKEKSSQEEKKQRGLSSVKRRWDLFNGNVKCSGEITFIYALITIIVIAEIIMLATDSPESPDDLQYADLAFCRVETQDGDLLLYTDGIENYYFVPIYQEIMTEPETFLQLCRKGAVFHVGYIYLPSADVPHFAVHSIVDSRGAVYLTPQDVFKYKSSDYPYVIPILAGLGVLNLMVFCLLVCIGRHPEKFSPRTIGLFFRDGAVARPNRYVRRRNFFKRRRKR